MKAARKVTGDVFYWDKEQGSPHHADIEKIRRAHAELTDKLDLLLQRAIECLQTPATMLSAAVLLRTMSDQCEAFVDRRKEILCAKPRQ